MSVSNEVELLVDARAEVGEGPVWDDARKRLLWVDILAGRLHTCDPVTGDDAWRDVGQPLGAVALRARGGLVLALGDVTISNGLGWSSDDRTMYYVDSPTQSIDAFDYDGATGAIENRRVLVAVPEELGFVDGLTVDAEGFIWAAVFGGGRLHRYAPDGSLERAVRLPIEQPTKPAFGGPGLAELYVTSAWHGLSDAQRERQPTAGSVLRLRPGVSGVVANRFGG